MIPKEILDLIKWEEYPWRNYTTGGQNINVMAYGSKLVCKEMGFEFATDHHRSQVKNKQLCLLFFELYLSETGVI